MAYVVLFDEVIQKQLVRREGEFLHPLPWGIEADDSPAAMIARMRSLGVALSWERGARRRLISNALPYGQSDGVFLFFDFDAENRLSAVGIALNHAA